MVSDNTIEWKISMRVDEPVNINQQQSNIMLRPVYRDWLTIGGSANGTFPEEFSDKDEGWRTLYEAKDFKLKNAAVKGKGIFPSLAFVCTMADKTYLPVFKNTDNIFKSRVLCFYKNNGDSDTNYLQPGAYEYFNGKIEIATLQAN